MGVDLEPESHVNTNIDNAKFVGSSGNELCLKVFSSADAIGIGTAGAVEWSCPVDESVGHAWWSTLLDLVPQLFSRSVIPVLDHKSTQVFIIVGGGGPVDDQWAVQAVTILKSKVRMIPSGSVLGGGESVGHAFTRSNRTLGDTGNSIILRVVELAHAVEMSAGSVLSETVGDMYHKGVSPVCDQGWAWDGPVVGEDEAGESIWCNCDVFYGEPILADYSSDWSDIVPVEDKISSSFGNV